MRIELTATEAVRLRAAARQTGATPAELVKRLTFENLPDVPVTAEDAVDARLSQWQEQDGIPLAPDVPAQILFAQWAEEDASMTESERGAEDQLWEEFQKSLNATRAALGMRRL